MRSASSFHSLPCLGDIVGADVVVVVDVVVEGVVITINKIIFKPNNFI